MKNEPKRHHYIPQFILKNFCINGTDFLWYFDKQSKQLSKKKTKDVFMVRNLYRDEINIPDNPTEIENDLAKYENEISKILKEKFLTGEKIELTSKEDDKIKLFFAIMSFRSKATNQMFGEHMTQNAKKYYKNYQKNEDFQDLWKRNLGYIVKCRSIKEIIEHPDIDDPFKFFFYRDTIGNSGLITVVVEPKEGESFLIGDTYPVDVRGVADSGREIPLYGIFPISRNRVILMAESGAREAPREVTHFRDCIFIPPISNQEADTIRIRVKKLYSEEVRYINGEIFKTANDGVSSADKTVIGLITQ